MNVLLATQKPFAAAAVKGITDILEAAGHKVSKLEKYAQQSDFVAAVADAEALIIRSDKVTEEVMAAAPKLKIVVRAGAGFDNVDLAAATARGIVVMNTPGQNSNAVAELALCLMIFMARTQLTPATGSELLGTSRLSPAAPRPSTPWKSSMPHRTTCPSTSPPCLPPLGASAMTLLPRCLKAPRW